MMMRKMQRLPIVLIFSFAAATGASARNTADTATPPQKTFATAQDAAIAFAQACEQQDTAAMLGILGPAGKELVSSGDEAQDKRRLERYARMSKEAMEVRPDPLHLERYLVYVGTKDWPLPIPIIKDKDAYRFDTAAAKSEILARRVGRNELDAIKFLHELVQAEVDFAYADRSNSELRDYAQKILSDPDKHNGLYWEAKEGEAPSFLADFMAHAIEQGYELPAPGDPFIYHGYVFRILTGQGGNVAGGALEYVVHGDMIGGFAIVAYPTDYAVSGVKTFAVNHDGVIWEKDLGDKTKTLAAGMKVYNPDKTWTESPSEEETDAAATAKP